MINLTISEAMTAADGQLVHCEDPAYIGDMFIEGITLDSRKVKPDWLFIADKGERADGHDYVESARRSGAAAAVVEHELDIPIPQILVENSLRAMQRIAGYIREKSGVKVIGVVGSVGKTSTRQMLSCVLEQKFSVLSTEGNFNNEYGLPQTFSVSNRITSLRLLKWASATSAKWTDWAQLHVPITLFSPISAICTLRTLSTAAAYFAPKPRL